MPKQSTPVNYGGQAVIEGVMFGGKNVNVTAVRRKNGEITYLEVPRKDKSWVRSLRRIPLLRGIISLIDSSAKGSRHLNYASDAYSEDQMDPEEYAKEKEKEKEESKTSLSMILGVAVVGVISLVVGKLIFTLVPAVLESLIFRNMFQNLFIHNLLEGAIKIILLLAYLWGISQTPMIKRLFQYHGAEHKVITAFEHGAELTPENVQKFSRLHYRCGSSFIILTVIIGVIIYSFFHWDGLAERVLQRIILLPLVIGVSFEFLKFTNSLRDVPVLRYLGYPGLWLQLLTTKEPTLDQLEVSIASFNRMRELDAQLEKESVSAIVPDASPDPVKG